MLRGQRHSDGVQFCNFRKQPFDWENEELAETLPEAEEPVCPDVLAEVPGLVLESDSADDDDAVMTPAPPSCAALTFQKASSARASPRLRSGW